MIVYKVLIEEYGTSEMSRPWWATTNLWVQVVTPGEHPWVFMQKRAAEMCVEMLERRWPNREFKIVEEEE
jgi:hypothetical protein